jgi:RNA binding exosome subunit
MEKMIAHQVELTVFSTPEDDEAAVYKNLLLLLPFDTEAEKLKVEKTNASGFSERKIVIMRLILSKQRHINPFLEKLADLLNQEQKELLLRQAESRLDENMYFFLRLDKPRLAGEGKCWLTDDGNCYHIKLSLAPFPRKRENALEIVRGLFSVRPSP